MTLKKHYIFDLDNTLYHSSSQFFNQQLEKMSEFIQLKLKLPKLEADFLRDDYYTTYGTTMHGLMANYHIDPKEYLSVVDDVSLDRLLPNNKLLNLLRNLKLEGAHLSIFTNGSDYHADRVMRQLNLDKVIEDVVTLQSTSLVPKPDMRAYEYIISKFNINPANATFFEDSSHNLIPAKVLGMETVLINADDTAQARFVAHPEIDLLVENVESYFKGEYLLSSAQR
ncbi:pyrimidine 5'-nucleotidase [Fangia hongkongensis]|uniref:pyrimidine 5'-nucleotidase n=1 Tax=Fangia hongkongensis TaxID=270495 RepID=UPI00036BF53D|nr:pyrimidine 5'-nucleotidase [Fangia hongkongensis]MBK2124277.1 pyrimidine 5'-nucleotidase [Fangia hongkongensis]